MASPFEGYEVHRKLQPTQQNYSFDLEEALAGIVALEATAPHDATTANTLGTERIGNGVVINGDGLVLTIGYLVIEATDVTLVTNAGRRVPAHVLGSDPVTGFGLVQALEPLDLPPRSLGDSRALEQGAPLLVAGGGGTAHALSATLLARQPFAGYWEYLLDEALFVGPAHPHWSGAALLGPEGELVGIGSLAMEADVDGDRAPVNMCVPIELLPPILDRLARGQPTQPARPWLGVLAHEMSSSVIIAGVTPGGPADRAGLHQGDIVLAVAGSGVRSLGDFYRKLWAEGAAGVTIPLQLRREDDVFDVEVRSIDRTSTLKRPRFN